VFVLENDAFANSFFLLLLHHRRKRGGARTIAQLHTRQLPGNPAKRYHNLRNPARDQVPQLYIHKRR
jgi:hypothetical protein